MQDIDLRACNANQPGRSLFLDEREGLPMQPGEKAKVGDYRSEQPRPKPALDMARMPPMPRGTILLGCGRRPSTGSRHAPVSESPGSFAPRTPTLVHAGGFNSAALFSSSQE
jgi:hypothetical protein